MSMTNKQKYDSIKDMYVPTKISLMDMADVTYQKHCDLEIDAALFQPFPSELVFQNYAPNETYTLPLILRNQDKLPRLVKILQPDSPYFKVISPTNISHKIAGGLAHVFTIQFTPDEKRDFCEDLICITEREKFVIPIKCVGCRAILDFPDELNFPITPVKYVNERVLFVRNIGNADAKCRFVVDSPFKITPQEARIPINQGVQIKVEYSPQKIVSSTGFLHIHYSTGETVRVKLSGDAQEVTVRLDKTHLNMEDTYVSMLGTRTVTIHNNSDICATYKWTRYATALEEEMQRTLQQDELQKQRELEFGGNEQPENTDHIAVAERSAEHEEQLNNMDAMLFEDDVMKIIPLQGEIWPRCSAEITVCFVPSEAREFHRVAYCDVTGRESRLALKLSGTGVGAKVNFSYKRLQMGRIFLASAHEYELVLANKGDIDALFCIESATKAGFSDCFSFLPFDGLICPGAYQQIKVRFNSNVKLGDFVEAFNVKFDGCPEPEQVIFEGSVVGPTFDLDQSTVDFGTVSFDFPITKTLLLNNSSFIPMTFKLRMLETTAEKEVEDDQFTMSPSGSYTLDAMSSMPITIHYLPKRLGFMQRQLAIDVERIGEKILTIPVSADCDVPSVDVRFATIDHKRIFIGAETEMIIELVNNDPLRAKFDFIPSELSSPTTYLYESSEQSGTLEPQSTTRVTIKMRVFQLGKQSIDVPIDIIGFTNNPIVARFECIGEGPVLHVEPQQIDWGTIAVLNPVAHRLTIGNESPIDANVKFELFRKDSVFYIEENEIVIPAFQQTNVPVFAYADDIMLFKDRLLIHVENVPAPHTVELKVVGLGSTMKLDPDLPEELELGPHFSSLPLEYTFKVANLGRRPQQLIWSVDDTKKRFSITPHRSEVNSGQSLPVTLTIRTTEPSVVTGTVTCFAIVGRRGAKEIVRKCQVTAHFIAPMVEFSSLALKYYLERQGLQDVPPLTQELTMENKSGLDLSCHLETSPPFSLTFNGKQSTTLEISMTKDDRLTLEVIFDPNFSHEKHSWSVTEAVLIRYADHPYTDSIELFGEVHFPNVEFSSQEIDFGFILNHTEVTRNLCIKNTSPIPVRYEWSFVIGDRQNLVFRRETRLEEDQSNPLTKSTCVNSVLQSLLDDDCEVVPLGVEEVFDISPLSGVIDANDAEIASVNFYGHPDIEASVTAILKVEGGPHYTMPISGGSSNVLYELSNDHLNFGNISFMLKSTKTLSITNRSKVGFHFSLEECRTCEQASTLQIHPMTGYLAENEDATVEVTLSSTSPVDFCRHVLLRVAHFPARTLLIYGTFTFPCLAMNLPHFPTNWKPATENQTAMDFYHGICEQLESENVEGETVDLSCDCGFLQRKGSPGVSQVKQEMHQLRIIAMESERRFLQLLCSDQVDRSQVTAFCLPEYVCDFGNVVLGEVASKIVQLRNIGPFALSLRLDRQSAQEAQLMGFCTNLTCIRHLPSPQDDAVDLRDVEFEIVFDPRGVNLDVGSVESYLIYKFTNGPIQPLRLMAKVCIPQLSSSGDIVDFGTVKLGEAKIINVQLFNPGEVTSVWMLSPKKVKSNQKRSRLYPKKLKSDEEEKVSVPVFELLTSMGEIQPQERINIQIKFAPDAEKTFEERLILTMLNSCNRLQIFCSGKGLEPVVDFEQAEITFTPILPLGYDEQSVTISNPCDFPIELYNLEFDHEYRKEDEILRMLTDYDSHDMLLLPPREAGEPLPPALHDFYAQELKKQRAVRIEREETAESSVSNDQEKSGFASTPETQATPAAESKLSPEQSIRTKSSRQSRMLLTMDRCSQSQLEETDLTPVTKVMAKYLGVDLSESSQLAKKCQGIAVILHLPPKFDGTCLSGALGARYRAVVFSLEDVIMHALRNSSSLSAERARKLCLEAGKKYAESNGLLALYMQEIKNLTDLANGEGPTSPFTLKLSDLAESAVLEAEANVASDDAQPLTIPVPTSPKASPRKGSLGKAVPVADSPVSQLAKVSKKLDLKGFISLTQCSSNNMSSLSVSAPASEHNVEIDMYTTNLPDELIVDLLAERFLETDCANGLVINGLECSFCPSYLRMMNCVLRALNNRRFCYALTVDSDYDTYLARVEAETEARITAQRLEEDLFHQFVCELDEFEYAELPEEEQRRVDEVKLRKRKQKRQEQLDRISEQEEERQRLESEMRKSDNEKGGKGGKLKGNQSAMSGKMHTQASARQDHKDTSESRNTDHNDEADRSRKVSMSHGVEAAPEKPMEPLTEEERLLQFKFKVFEAEMKPVCELLSRYDRVGAITNQTESSNAVEKSGDQNIASKKSKSGSMSTSKKNTSASKDPSSVSGAFQAAASPAVVNQSSVVVTPLEPIQHTKLFDQDEPKADFEAPLTHGIHNLIFDLKQHQNMEEDVVKEVKPVTDEEMIRASELMLPSLFTVLESAGRGPMGPPLPEPQLFSAIRMPPATEGRRTETGEEKSETAEEQSNFVFVVAGPDDQNIQSNSTVDQQTVIESINKSVTTTNLTTNKNSSSGGRRSTASNKTSSHQHSDSTDKKTTATLSIGAKSRKDSRSVVEDLDDSVSMVRDSSFTGPTNEPLNKFRWIIPAKDSITLRIRFAATNLGHYNKQLNFELLGSRRRYQLNCTGHCLFPTISQEPRLVYADVARSMNAKANVAKKFILDSGKFYFGPLLVEKTKDRVCEGCYPENITNLQIVNSSPMEIEVSFALLQDTTEENFSLSQHQLTLLPSEKHTLTVWAHPKSHGCIEDAVVACLKDNPEPILFNVMCDGVLPELQLDKKQIHFERVLLHRKEVRSITLFNPTKLPVAWRLTGMETLGEDFTLSQDSGLINPRNEFELTLFFRAMKPYKPSQKKSLRLEVYDSSNIGGVIQVETIQVSAEAYDVALDLIYPKGCDGFVDFGLVKVGDECRQILGLKNKGIYEIEFRIDFVTQPNGESWDKYFLIQPMKGVLHPGDKSVQILITSKAICEEIILKNETVFHCHVIEPISKTTEQLIAKIPVKFSLRSLFSKFSISPSKDVDFGAIVFQSRKQRQMVIENRGEFEFKFSISRMEKLREITLAREVSKNAKNELTRDNAQTRNGLSGMPAAAAAATQGSKGYVTVPWAARNILCLSPGKLQTGMFTISPSSGSIPPGNAQIINIDCVADNLGICDELLGVEITDRDVREYKMAVPYRLVVESCMPGIEIANFKSMFEEHRIFENALNLPTFNQLAEITIPNEDFLTGSFCIQSNCFHFGHVLVGRTVKARIRINNPNRVPADVVCTIKGMPGVPGLSAHSGRASSRSAHQQQSIAFAPLASDAFDVLPARTQIKPHSSVHVNVSFNPQTLQMYEAQLEIGLENVPFQPGNIGGTLSNQSMMMPDALRSRMATPAPENKPLQDDTKQGRKVNVLLSGEGQLPHFALLKPSLRRPNGQPSCVFQRIKVDQQGCEPLILLNNGSLVVTLTLDLHDCDGVFFVTSAREQACLEYLNGVYSNNNDPPLAHHKEKPPHLASVTLQPNEKCELELRYIPRRANERSLANLHISVLHNAFEEVTVELLGETLSPTDPIIIDRVPRILDEEALTLLNTNLRQFPSLKAENFKPKPPSPVPQAAPNAKKDHAKQPLPEPVPEVEESSTGVDVKEKNALLDDWDGAEAILHNHLNFGDCPVGEAVTQVITISYQKVDNFAYPVRFQWVTNGEDDIVKFKPAVGHIRPGQSKPIRVTLLSSRSPLLMRKRLIACKLTPIELVDADAIADWDDSKIFVKWIDHFEYTHRTSIGESITSPVSPEATRSNTDATSADIQNGYFKKKKVTEADPEPEWRPITDDNEAAVSMKSISLLVSAIIDYSRVACEVRTLRFKDTHILEARKHTVTLANLGVVTACFHTSVVAAQKPHEDESITRPLSARSPTNLISENSNENLSRPKTSRPHDRERLFGTEISPFKVAQKQGVILPGQTQTLNIEFAPLSVGEHAYHLIVEVENSEKTVSVTDLLANTLAPAIAKTRPDDGNNLAAIESNSTLVISLSGLARASFLHLEGLDDSKYLLADTRATELANQQDGFTATPTLPIDTRVIEMTVVGIGSNMQKSCYLENPTRSDYAFELCRSDVVNSECDRAIACPIQKGIVTAGNRHILTFTFKAEQLGVVESLWKLLIPSHDFVFDLLIVGRCLEPEILFDRSHVSFPPVLVGHTVTRTVHLINLDNTKAYPFAFDQQSLFGPSAVDWVDVTPMSGVLQPMEKCPVEISFTARGERDVNINMRCRLKGKLQPLNMNIKAKCCSMSLSVWLEANDQSDNGQPQIEIPEILPYCDGVDPVAASVKACKQIVQNASARERLQTLDFGVVEFNEIVIRTITIINNGQLSFDFAWQLDRARPLRTELPLEAIGGLTRGEHETLQKLVANGIVSVQPRQGSVPAGERLTCQLAFAPPERSSRQIILDNLLGATLAIVNGPAYGLALAGRTALPSLAVSEEQLDFGTVIVPKPGLNFAALPLRLTNTDPKKAISVECVSHLRAFVHNIAPTILQPNSSIDLTITFAPTQALTCSESLEIEVNGLTRYTVKLRGQGVELRFDTFASALRHHDTKRDKRPNFKPAGRIIDMGTLSIGQTSRRLLEVVNPTKADIFLQSVELHPIADTSAPAATEKSLTWRILNGDSQSQSESMLIPAKGGKVVLELIYSPKSRCSGHVEELFFNVLGNYKSDVMQFSSSLPNQEKKGTSIPICLAKSVCQAAEFHMDSEQVTFGAIVKGSQMTKRLVLINSGDLGARFTWVEDTIPKDVTVEPLQGYLASGMRAGFNVTLKPSELAADLRYEGMKCRIEGFGVIAVTVSGLCVPPQMVKDVQTFQCPVRQQDTRSIPLFNRTNVPWLLKPVIQSTGANHWTGAEQFEVPAQQQQSYAVTYKPTTMTLEGKKHQGSLLFALPDGTGLCYSLVGTADPPKPCERITREIPCKSLHVEVITITNWLKTPQRFKVVREIVKPDKPDSSMRIEGLNFLEVAGASTKNYKLNVHVYKEGPLLLRITFMNEETGEYQQNDMYYKVTRGGAMDVIKLTTPIRCAKPYQLKLENPLATQVQFQLSSNIAELRMPTQVQIPGHSEGYVGLEYMPLKSGEQTGRLEATSAELGVFEYGLELTAQAALPGRCRPFRAYLGQSQMQTVNFTNWTKGRADFACKIDSSEFTCDKSVAVPHGAEGSLDVTFEPTQLGTIKAQLLVSSPSAGDFVFNLVGEAGAPLPLGPIPMRSGETVYIPFKNVFNSTVQFTFNVDNPVFHLAKNSETIRAKKEYRISVSLESLKTSTLPVGKLTISCARFVGKLQPGNGSAAGTDSSRVSWTYYLRSCNSSSGQASATATHSSG